MIVVTGAAGFIGSNIIKGLNARGIHDILAVDDLSDGKKFKNLAVVHYKDYMDHQTFLTSIVNGTFKHSISAVFHQGACSDTTEWNGRYMMENNYEYSKVLFHHCLSLHIPFIYASSAAIYGGNSQFDDQDWQQLPLNVYGYSKWKFDQYIKPYLNDPSSQIVGLRYFNVYGPHENHKGKMASVAFHLMNQLRDHNEVKLFEGHEGYGNGEQQRDFIFVEDVVKVNLWFYENPNKHGIFNCGTGQARPFNAIANKLLELHGQGELKYIPFPDHLKGAYQSHTQANIHALRQVGFTEAFTSLEQGLENYYQWFHTHW